MLAVEEEFERWVFSKLESNWLLRFRGYFLSGFFDTAEQFFQHQKKNRQKWSNGKGGGVVSIVKGGGV